MPQQVHFIDDPGCDDSIMLLMALASDDIEVTGITVSAGNTTLENATRNTLALLEYTGRIDIPVAVGCHRPLVDPLETIADMNDIEEIHGSTGLTVSLPEPQTDPIDLHGQDFIIEQAREYGDDLVISSMAPQTTMAMALAKEPSLPDMVDYIVLMGGALKTAGNVTPSGEFNFYFDPAAASRVMQDGSPRMVPLDITEQTHVPTDRIREFEERGGAYETIARLLDYYPQEALDRLGYHDGPVNHCSVIIADILHDIIEYTPEVIDVGTGGGICHGATVYDGPGVTGRAPNALVGTSIDVERYHQILVDILLEAGEKFPA